jgi:spermidine synthase
MTPFVRFVLFLLFLASGFCGLLYQVVWMRMAFASFGVVTSVLSVVVSVFMLGLFVGSWSAGRWVDRLTNRTGIAAIYLYALAEWTIAIGAWAVPRLFTTGERLLLVAGERDSYAYLIWSALIVAGSILPWCVSMGTTFPLMTAFVKEQDESSETSFSFLYLANVIGAMLGTLLSALVLIELLGFRRTLWVAAATNLLIGLAALCLGMTHRRLPQTMPAAREGDSSAPLQLEQRTAETPHRKPVQTAASQPPVALILFITGFTSMAMEVVWTRAFTPVLKTQVYSFALLLFVYLSATWIGSLLYRRHLAHEGAWSTGKLMALLASAALFPLAMNDPRLFFNWFGALASIIPFCALLGYLTPKLIDEFSHGRPDRVGSSYAANILGCILGPLAASYFLLPAMGLKYVLLTLAGPYFVLLLWFVWAGALPLKAQVISGTSAAVLVAFSFFSTKCFDDPELSDLVLRDHTATVTCHGAGMRKELLVNGMGMTILHPVTKIMSHLTLASLEEPPKSALVICFGMGTTWRSAMSWNISVTAVELVPSVRDAFPYYFADAATLRARPNGKIVIDDGRRFLHRTDATFDVIIIDPPPPIEAAGSSLLYSQEFYQTARLHLSPKGILHQWIPDPCEPATAQAMARSILQSFPYVKMFVGYQDMGTHVLASNAPIPHRTAEELVTRMPASAVDDIVEWMPANNRHPVDYLQPIVTNELNPKSVGGEGADRVTDDQPFNEYFLLRMVAAALNETPTSESLTNPPPRDRKR